MEKINWEEISFGIITAAGMAKSNAIFAIRLSKQGNFKEAEEKLEAAENNITEAEKKHMDVIVQEAKGEKLEFKALFMHAEDQMLTAQMMIEVAKEMVELWKFVRTK